MDAIFFSNTATPSHTAMASHGLKILVLKAARKLFRADNFKQASNKDERDTMSLKRPRNIEVNTIDHRRIGPAELKTLLPDKASLERTRRIDDSRSNQTQDESEGERLVR